MRQSRFPNHHYGKSIELKKPSKDDVSVRNVQPCESAMESNHSAANKSENGV